MTGKTGFFILTLWAAVFNLHSQDDAIDEDALFSDTSMVVENSTILESFSMSCC